MTDILMSAILPLIWRMLTYLPEPDYVWHTSDLPGRIDTLVAIDRHGEVEGGPVYVGVVVRCQLAASSHLELGASHPAHEPYRRRV